MHIKSIISQLARISGLVLAASLCTSQAAGQGFQQDTSALLAGEAMAVAYSGFREGQHPDRGEGAVNPSKAEILEDLEILSDAGFRLIRLYDSGENSAMTLELIRLHNLPIKVLLGAWLKAEVSNHEACPWLTEPIPDEVLTLNQRLNAREVDRTIRLANTYPNVVVATNVGTEALVEWNDHMVPVNRIIGFVRRVKQSIGQPVTVAENHAWWTESGADLAAELDFVGVHTYPVWEGRAIEDALSFTIENIEGVHAALPGRQIAILEAGWPTKAVEFGEWANEANQQRHYLELEHWARMTHTTVVFFEAFDEPWKGDPNNPATAEKHWGLFFVDRSPKQAMREITLANQHQ